MRTLRLAWVYFRVGALNELQYRANLALQLLQSAISIGVGIAVLGLVFRQTPQLNGWSPAQLLVVMGVHTIMGGVIGTFIAPNMQRLREDVRLGTFDYVLTKPADAQVLSSVREVRIWRAVDIVVGAVVLVTALGLLPGTIGAWEAAVFMVALGLGALMIYAFWLLLTSAAFWIVRVDEISELFDGVFQSGRWPVSIYPGWLRVSLTFLVPIAFAVTVPAEALTGRLTPDVLLLAAAFAVVAVLGARWVFKRGLRRYGGASA